MAPAELIYWGAALALGAGAGLAFLLAWRMFLPAGTQSRFWNQLSALGLKAITVDELDEFLAIYRGLFAALGGYLGRNLAVAAVGGVAVVVVLLALFAPLQSIWDRQDGRLVMVAAGGGEFALRESDGHARIAVCAPDSDCTWLTWLGFTIKPGAAAAIIRASHQDRNPLWPYVSDLEAMFALGLLISPLFVFILPKARTASAEGFQLKAGDFALVQINEQLKPLVRAVGDFESRMARSRLDAIPLDRPIYVTGLARSGTTTVLAALTQSREVGSHQYRDFPFVAAPLTWSRFQGTFGKDVQPVERPHKDRILITSASPDAFEEPLWRQFFPTEHERGRDQRLTTMTSNPEFEAFYADHLRKILMLRGAARYVSKGNYNVGRIEYLARLFPDALFIVPVRHPLEHIASLRRQHQLFCRYASADPRVPLYLAAAGHFEFGPQRRPLVLSRNATCQSCLDEGDDILGYAQQWAEVYGHVTRLAGTKEFADRILLLRYEDFCAGPATGLDQIIQRSGLLDPDGAIRAYAQNISASAEQVPDDIFARRVEIDELVGAVARAAGYSGN